MIARCSLSFDSLAAWALADGIDELRREISERSVPTEKTWWGYDAIRVVDPDGNELLFPLDETNDRERQT